MARVATWGVVAAALLVVAVAARYPYPLDQGDQGKQAQYVLDCVVNHHLLVPSESGSTPATKPPLYTWLAVVCARAGGVSVATVQLPALAAGFALALVVLALARRLLPERAAVAATLAFLTCHHFVRITSFIRTDGLLTLFLTLQLYLYVRTWEPVEPRHDLLQGCESRPGGGPVLGHLVSRWFSNGSRSGRRETSPRHDRPSPSDSRERPRPSTGTIALLCLASAAAWLTKGPIGGLASVVIGLHLGLRGRARAAIPLAVVPALAGVVALGVWFAAAVATRGAAVYETMVVGELRHHTVGHGLTNPLYYLVTTAVRITPWQLLLPAAIGIGWRAGRAGGWRHLSPEQSLLLLWSAVWLVALSLISHQRPDLFFPAEPALFLLLGRIALEPGGRPYLVGLALLLVAGGGAVASGLAGGVVGDGAPAWVGGAAGVALLAGGALAWRGRRAGLVAAFGALGAAALANLLLAFAGNSAVHRAASFADFGKAVREQAAARSARLVAVGVVAPSPLFHLRLAEPPVAIAALADLGTPLMVVCPQTAVAAVTAALSGCTAVATSSTAEEDGVRDLVALACGGR